MKRFYSIKSKLFISFACILIIPALIIGIMAYTNARSTLEDEMMSGIDQNLGLLNETINSTIESRIHDMEIFADDITADMYDGIESPELREELDQYVRLHPEVMSIFVGTSAGLLVEEPQVVDNASFDPRERGWYTGAMENAGSYHISEPYVDAATNEFAVAVSRALEDGSGVIAVNINLGQIQEITSEVTIGQNGYALIMDENKRMISHPEVEAGTVAEEAFYDNMYTNESGNFEYTLDGDDKQMRYMTNELTGWKIGGNLFSSEIREAAMPIFWATGIVIVIAIGIGSIVAYYIIRSIIKPINDLKDSANVISQGDLTEDIDVKSKDEIGQLAVAFKDMQASLKVLVNEVDGNAQQVAASAEELTASADQSTDTTEQVASAIQEVSASAEKQTTGVENNARSLEEVSMGVTKIVDSSNQVSDLVKQTTEQAEIGGKAVQDTVSQMKSIHDSVQQSNVLIESLDERSKEVSSILDVITDISDQTNLLSLNAAIEAARAGEHGKGFAVVADEVRKLAEQSQKSAKEIFAIVKGIQEDVDKAVQNMNLVTSDVKSGVDISTEAIEKFDQILEGTRKITPEMQGVTNIADQMSGLVQDVSSTANELSTIAQGNAAVSEEVAASTEEQLASIEEISASAKSLASMAEELSGLIAKFKR